MKQQTKFGGFFPHTHRNCSTSSINEMDSRIFACKRAQMTKKEHKSQMKILKDDARTRIVFFMQIHTS